MPIAPRYHRDDQRKGQSAGWVGRHRNPGSTPGRPKQINRGCAIVTIGDPYAESPTVGEQWRAMDDTTRRMLCHRTLFGMPVTVLEARPNGHVIVKLDDDLDAAKRGILLREAERKLKDNVDPAMLVYLEPAQDKNALRRLRGVKVAE